MKEKIRIISIIICTLLLTACGTKTPVKTVMEQNEDEIAEVCFNDESDDMKEYLKSLSVSDAGTVEVYGMTFSLDTVILDINTGLGYAKMSIKSDTVDLTKLEYTPDTIHYPISAEDFKIEIPYRQLNIDENSITHKEKLDIINSNEATFIFCIQDQNAPSQQGSLYQIKVVTDDVREHKDIDIQQINNSIIIDVDGLDCYISPFGLVLKLNEPGKILDSAKNIKLKMKNNEEFIIRKDGVNMHDNYYMTNQFIFKYTIVFHKHININDVKSLVIDDKEYLYEN